MGPGLRSGGTIPREFGGGGNTGAMCGTGIEVVEDEEHPRERFPRSRYMRRYSLLFATERKTPHGLIVFALRKRPYLGCHVIRVALELRSEEIIQYLKDMKGR